MKRKKLKRMNRISSLLETTSQNKSSEKKELPTLELEGEGETTPKKDKLPEIKAKDKPSEKTATQKKEKLPEIKAKDKPSEKTPTTTTKIPEIESSKKEKPKGRQELIPIKSEPIEDKHKVPPIEPAKGVPIRVPQKVFKAALPKSIGKIEKEYQITIDDATVDIRIEKLERGHKYTLFIPRIETGTEALLSYIRKELTAITTIAIGEIVDQKSINETKKRFIHDAKKLLKEKIPTIALETENLLVGLLMQEMLGLGKVEFLISDPSLEEIVIISSKEPVRVYHKNYGWLSTNIFLKSEDEILNFSNIIARRIGRQISILSPLLDAHVVTGDRANAVLYPISTKGHTITIRKFSRDPWTIIDLIQNKTVSIDMASLLWLAFEFEMNVLISGGTGSGKTVFLNACMPFIPPNHRIISMEDTRELTLPEFLYWCPLVTRSPNAEGKGEVSMLDLLINSLRMRPDRIVLGEIRRQREAEVLFEAMHTGHSVYATLHADTANETIRRLTNPPINIPSSLVSSVNLNVVMFRDRKKGFRRVFQLAEFMSGKDNISANVIHRWIPETDKFTEHNKSMTFFDTLSRHTGMAQKDINDNLKNKKAIIEWLIKNNIRDLESIGKVMNTYYTNKEELEKIMRTNKIERITDKEPEVRKGES
jgi:archaeal flagellar protein FlaI